MCESCKPNFKALSGEGDAYSRIEMNITESPFEPIKGTFNNWIIQPKPKYIINAETYIRIAAMYAGLSKYDGTKVGCLLVKDGNTISHGINGYPKMAHDEGINAMPREDRLKLAIHAEENALLKLMETGQNPVNSIAYVTHHPCIKCAARLYSAGIRTVVIPKQDDLFMETWIRPDAKAFQKLAHLTIAEVKEIVL